MIDVHAHAVLEMVLGAAGEHGPELYEEGGEQRFRVGGYTLCGVRYRGSLYMDLDVRLAAMDEAGIDFQVLSPNPLTFFHHIGPADAIAFCRRHNDAMAQLVGRRPDRLGGLACLPMQDPAAAAAELQRSSEQLGLLGVYTGTDFGRDLDDPALDDLYALSGDLGVPWFLHPAPSGIDGPLLDSRLRRFDLDLILEFAYEETIAVATLIYGGVLQRHPALDVVISHGGGAAALLYPKLRYAASRRPWSPDWLREEGAFEQLFRRLWFDVHVGDSQSLDLLAARADPDRLVFGTNFGGWDSGVAHRPGPELTARLDANARRLLGLDPSIADHRREEEQ